MQDDSAGRALSSVVTKMIKNKGLPYSVYSILYHTCITSISQYGSEVFGYNSYDSFFKLYLRAARSFLGLPKSVTSFGVVSELDWLLPQSQTQIKMIQYLGRIFRTSNERLMVKVFNWDRKLDESGSIRTWCSEIKEILNAHNLSSIFERAVIFPVKNVVAQLKTSMMEKQIDLTKAECLAKPKLRTFVRFKDFGTLPSHLGKPLSFIERKTLIS